MPKRIWVAYLQMSMFLTRLVCCRDLDAGNIVVYPEDAVGQDLELAGRRMANRVRVGRRLDAEVEGEVAVVGDAAGGRYSRVEDVEDAAVEVPAGCGGDDAV